MNDQPNDEKISQLKMAHLQQELHETLIKIMGKHLDTSILSINNFIEILAYFIGIGIQLSFDSIIESSLAHDEQKYNPKTALDAVYLLAKKIVETQYNERH